MVLSVIEEGDDAEEQEEDEDEEKEWLCGDCNGSGEGMYGGTICHFCKGLGIIYGSSTESD